VTEEHVDGSLSELKALTETAGDVVAETVIESRDSIHPRTFIGPGQAEELGRLAKSLKADVIIFNESLSPSQQRNLEEVSRVRVVDRTGVILEIFARHARSKEGVIQVELAQNEYRLPRLRGKGLEMSRMAGGIGTRRGPGEMKLEIDRRRVQSRISHLKKELDQLIKVRATQSKRRKKKGVYEVCLVGYTNAGKSTLLNKLTGADVLVANKLFATLDSTTRKLALPPLPQHGSGEIVLSDTVGFIRDLPHQLIAAFRSTLDGVREADLLLHVINVADANWREQAAAVEDVLNDINAGHVMRLNVFNKKDKTEAEEIDRLGREYPEAVFVSALKGEGLDKLVEAIAVKAAKGRVRVSLYIPEAEKGLLEKLYASSEIISENRSGDGLSIIADVPRPLLTDLIEYTGYRDSSVDAAEDGDDLTEH
jgi:GTPase